VRNLGYYTGAVFQVYDPPTASRSATVGATTSSWGASDARSPRSAFALNVERLHIALNAEARRA